MSIAKQDSTFIINRLQANKDKIKTFGIRTLGIFGSYARNEQHDKSDVDILIDFLDGKKNIRNFIYLADYLEEILDVKVDLILEKNLRPEIKSNVMEDVKYVQIQ
ncbi:MAG: nucleotidyltransferase family protein [Clostridia bacterium]|jgi:predicted nucleotidyltransferase|nr:nucleotidyltransferase family protein [Clostridia bacterium]